MTDGQMPFIEYLQHHVNISDEIRDILSGNEIDWSVCRELCDDDWHRMLPGKVGIVRKIRLLLASPYQAERSGVPGVPAAPPLPTLSTDSESVVHNMPPNSCTPNPPDSRPLSGSIASGLPLPVYSDRVLSAIKTGSIIADLDRMVEETAYHILKYGDIVNRGDYEIFGRRLLDVYPCIGFPGTEPWSFFCRKLSQKLRNIRWRRTTRSAAVVKSVSVKTKRRFISSHTKVSELSVADANKEMAAELQKQESERDVPRLKKLWDCLFDQRRTEITQIGDGCVNELLKKYPLLQQLKYIQSDFRRLCDPGNVEDSFRNILARSRAVLDLPDSGDANQEFSELEVVMLVQERLHIKVSPKNRLPPAISVVQQEELDLTSDQRSPPRLVIVQMDTCMQSAFILADTVHLQLTENDADLPRSRVCGMLLHILACYFAWDLSYPKQYQILTFLHNHLLGENKEHLFKSVALSKFEKAFLDAETE